MQSATPKKLLPSVWPLSISLATTLEISVDFFSSPYLDVSVREVTLIYLCIQYMIYKFFLYGLLHSEIHVSQRTYRSSWLIAVNHVLLRLPMPRHSLCALISLNLSLTVSLCLRFLVIVSFELVSFLLFRLFLLNRSFLPT